MLLNLENFVMRQQPVAGQRPAAMLERVKQIMQKRAPKCRKRSEKSASEDDTFVSFSACELLEV